MKYLTLIAILFGYAHSQTQEYIPNVPDYIASVFEVIGTTCVTDNDCESEYNGPTDFDNYNNSMWMCVNDTVTNGDNVEEISVCVFDGCTTNSDCTEQTCYTFGQCNPYNNMIYPMEELESTLCVPTLICNANSPGGLQTPGDYTNETMCYEGEDGETYTSKEYAVMCGMDNEPTCLVDNDGYLCIDPMMDTTDTAAAGCVDDETCCTKDGWDEEGCLELLITTYLMYTIIVAVVICLCCLGCCCCIYKKKKNGGSAKFQDDMDNQTNHYNVYI